MIDKTSLDYQAGYEEGFKKALGYMIDHAKMLGTDINDLKKIIRGEKTRRK